ncbi:RNI-like protein [Amylocystis lapponica]|nr:RNI-like protein [Amylocystis lapponica]
MTIRKSSFDPRSSWDHLSIRIPPHDQPIETSRFSPVSLQADSRTQSMWTTTTMLKSPKDLESGRPRSVASHLRDRFTKLFFDARTLRRAQEPDMVPVQPAELPPWQPLHIEKRGQCCEHCVARQQRKQKKHKRRRILLLLLIILLLYLLGNTVFLNVRTLNPPSSAAPTASMTTALSADAQLCLSQYNINAPMSPSSYPCSTCFPVLLGVPANFSDGDPQGAQQLGNAIQFCSLRSVFSFTDSAGQSALSNASWVQNVQFCAWGGVSCDGDGRVSSLELTFPGVPATLPDELGGLTGLQTLKVVGDTTVPAGALPSSFTSLTALSTLDIESTAITAFPDALFSSLKRVATLTLVKNSKMGGSLPSSLAGLSLQNLVDPSSISSLSSLTELHLGSNDLSGSLLDLSNNTGLAGAVSGSFCSLADLQDCDVSGTGLTAAGSCSSVCKFS